jgi:Asp/Glu/hydantoin racemase
MRFDWQARGQVEAHLMAEDAQRSRARAVVLACALLADVAKQIEILAHRRR